MISKELLKLILIAIGTTSTTGVEKQKIEQTIQWYFEGTKTGNTDFITKAFHSEAKLKHIKTNGDLYEADLNHFVNYLKENGGMPVLETQILDIDITETSASAKVLFVFEDFIYVDYLNLLRINNQWQIVDKIYMKKSIQ